MVEPQGLKEAMSRALEQAAEAATPVHDRLHVQAVPLAQVLPYVAEVVVVVGEVVEGEPP